MTSLSLRAHLLCLIRHRSRSRWMSMKQVSWRAEMSFISGQFLSKHVIAWIKREKNGGYLHTKHDWIYGLKWPLSDKQSITHAQTRMIMRLNQSFPLKFAKLSDFFCGYFWYINNSFDVWRVYDVMMYVIISRTFGFSSGSIFLDLGQTNLITRVSTD